MLCPVFHCFLWSVYLASFRVLNVWQKRPYTYICISILMSFSHIFTQEVSDIHLVGMYWKFNLLWTFHISLVAVAVPGDTNVVLWVCKPVVWLYIQWIQANILWFKRSRVSFVHLATNDCSEIPIILQAYFFHISYPHCLSLCAKLAFV